MLLFLMYNYIKQFNSDSFCSDLSGNKRSNGHKRDYDRFCWMSSNVRV